jgi:hypothetical protein
MYTSDKLRRYLLYAEQRHSGLDGQPARNERR